jgi:general secretion pathway protein D
MKIPRHLVLAGALALVFAMPVATLAADDEIPRSTNIQYMDILELIDRVAKRTGKQFVVDPRVRADVPLAGLDPTKVDYERLLAILRVNMFVAVEDGGIVIVLPDANARQLDVPTYTDLKFKALNDEVVTLVVQAKNACAAQFVPVLRPMMPQAAHLAAEVQSNSMIISDRASNARRIAVLFEKLDQATSGKRDCTYKPGS